MYTRAGIPGTGFHDVVHHVRGPSDEHASVQGNAAGFLMGALIAVAVIVVLAVMASHQA